MWFSRNESFVVELYPLYVLVLQTIGNGSIFYYNPSGHDCNWIWFHEHNFTSQQQWVWHTQTPYSTLMREHNNELFILACLTEKHYMRELSVLSKSLIKFNFVRVLIELASVNRTHKEDFLALNIFTYFRKKNMLNVALYYQNGTQPLKLYSCEVFPNFTLIQRHLKRFDFSGGTVLYPNQLADLKGFQLQALHDYSEPNTIRYRDANGKMHLTGFLWRFIRNFGKNIGANVIPMHPTWPAGRLLSEPHMLQFTKNGTVDFGLLTVQSSKNFNNKGHQYSYPIYLGSWCVMLPLERPTERNAIMLHILDTEVLIPILVGFGFSCLSFRIMVNRAPTWIRSCWSSVILARRLLALFLVCVCLAQIFQLMVSQPQQPPIGSFEDLIASGLHIFGLSAEFDLLDNGFRAKYAEAFRLTSNLSEFFRVRSSFNTSWAYSVSSIKWLILNEQQRHFQRPLFRFSDLCLSRSYPDSILLAEDSIYRDALKLYTMRVQQSGLLLHWMEFSLYDMVKAGLMDLKDHSKPLIVRALDIRDFRLTLHCYGVGLLLALFVFGVELLRFYVNVCLNNL